MFYISYDTWKEICDMYFSLSYGSKKSYLQWFPLFKLSKSDEENISGLDFYEKYIEKGSFILFDKSSNVTENYILKPDGSFRDATLVDPVLYLVLQCVGREINKKYRSLRQSSISVHYAGNYDNNDCRYKAEYDTFFKEINASATENSYFIKTDIRNFFSNINVDKLVEQIDKVCNQTTVTISQTQLLTYKSLLLYCGNGRFPLVENSISSSYLATIVYLDIIDKKLYDYLSNHVECFTSFQMIRYVDDLYILFNSDCDYSKIHEAYNEIRNYYSSILKDFDLSLNTKKCSLNEISMINEELKKSLYDEFYNGEKRNIEDLFEGKLFDFLQDISFNLIFDSIDVDKYNALVNEHFSSDDIEFTPSEVYNYFVYENSNIIQTKEIIDVIKEIIDQSISFISLDPKRLTVLILKTRDEEAIKALLNQLFSRNRNDVWNSYDTSIAITYLIQRQFKHIDLLLILKNKSPMLYDYYENNCQKSFIEIFEDQEMIEFCDVLDIDQKAQFLYFMYLCERQKNNIMAAYAYYKNFFDRITADLDFKYVSKPKKPNYKGFYKEGAIKTFYQNITDSASIIKTAHDLRNANPLSHSSSELLDHANTTQELLDTISKLRKMVNEYIEKANDEQP
ncbi:MAG: AbiA family abortive infection protein [Ruminococcus sp.]|nr:AbiA family abortive infection protein [Ruminococcus sp.]